MSASIITESDCSDIQAAMAVALLQHKNANGLTLEAIGKVIEREKQSVAQYINDTTEMPASCWLKLTDKWPELQQRLIFNLDEAEKAFLARQRSLNLEQPDERKVAA